MEYTVTFDHQEITYLNREALKEIAASQDTGGLIDDDGNLHFTTWRGFRLSEGQYPVIPDSPLLKALAPHIGGWVGFTLVEGLDAQLAFSSGYVLMESEDLDELIHSY